MEVIVVPPDRPVTLGVSVPAAISEATLFTLVAKFVPVVTCVTAMSERVLATAAVTLTDALPLPVYVTSTSASLLTGAAPRERRAVGFTIPSKPASPEASSIPAVKPVAAKLGSSAATQQVFNFPAVLQTGAVEVLQTWPIIRSRITKVLALANMACSSLSARTLSERVAFDETDVATSCGATSDVDVSFFVSFFVSLPLLLLDDAGLVVALLEELELELLEVVALLEEEEDDEAVVAEDELELPEVVAVVPLPLEEELPAVVAVVPLPELEDDAVVVSLLPKAKPVRATRSNLEIIFFFTK